MTDARSIEPLARPPDAVVTVPGSKSITNRALMLAALAEGESEISGALFSDDTRYMAAALRSLGLTVEEREEECRLRVVGCGGRWPAAAADLFVGNAGTAMRFLVAALCLGEGRYRIDGNERMRERPIIELVIALRGLGAHLWCEEEGGCPPVVVDASGLRGGTTEIDASRSSQFLSALLQVAPCASAEVEIVLGSRLIAAPYVEITLAVMRSFGVVADRVETRVYRIPAPQRYRGVRYTVEPDASSAHYFWAAAALTGGRARVEGIGASSLQGDVRFVDVLEQMGARVDRGEDAIEVRGGENLRGVAVDMNEISDTAPTLAVLGAFAREPVSIDNVEHLRWQESDRLRAVTTELRRLGVRVDERRGGLTVYPSQVRGGDVATYDDHRIAMSFALAGLVIPGIRVENPGCVAKTFPDFFERLEELRR